MSVAPTFPVTGFRARLLGLGARGIPARALAVAAASSAVAAAMGWGLWRLVDHDLLGGIAAAFSARPQLLGVFVGTYLGAFVLRTAAWRWLLRTPQPFGALLGITHLSLLANHALPAKPGDVLRAYLLHRRGTPAAEAAVTTLVSRLLDVVALVALVAVLWPLSAAGPSSAALPLLLAVAGLAALGLAALPAVARWGAGRLPPWTSRLLGSVAGAVSALPSGRAALALVVLVIPSWLLEAGVLWSVGQAAGHPIAVPVAAAVTAITIIPQAFQVTPGNLGVYEATMSAALIATGVEPLPALTLATATHALKFAYSYAGGAAVLARRGMASTLGWLRRRGRVHASRVELLAARAWNVLNEGKPFTVVFSLAVLAAVHVAVGIDGLTWSRLPLGLALAAPLAALFYRYDFPLHLRWALWGLAAAFVGWFRFADGALVAGLLAGYLGFTVVLWGTVYYHLRIGTPLTNFTRFWRLVLENPDTTSANFLEQVPKLFLVTHVAALGAGPGAPVGSLLAFTAAAGVVALLVHRWWFTWRPLAPIRPRPLAAPDRASARRVVLIVIDGCRADRLAVARTPVLHRLAAEGMACSGMETVYPARTVTAFSSMLTGAPPEVHGMRSNFIPRLGVRCESVFDVLRGSGRRGRLVGIAHLVDAFGDDVRAVTAVQDNDRIDETLVAEARDVMEREDPDLLVLQLLSVDQTGHARGSYREEYLERIEATDRLIGEFLGWLGRRGLLDGTTVAITADHGQGRGVGGHGHLGPGERLVPFVMWGAGVPPARRDEAPRSLLDVAPTICRFLGLRSPRASVGRDVTAPEPPERPLAVLIPVHDEEENLLGVLERIPAGLGDTRVIVVDDGSTDGAAELARRWGATVLRHPRRRGLGAALRTGLDAAAALDPWAVAYVDGDGEYDPAEIPRLLEPIRRGEADYVLGSRFLGRIEGMARVRRAGNAVFTAATSVLAGRRIGDAQTGMRALSARALSVAEIVHDYNYAQVLTLDLLSKGLRMAEVPITYRPRRRGRSFVSPRYLWRVPAGMAREVLGR
ncbi:MAG TPA: lysylphosphatidylglycerol synthase domain-containing protein [Actinomycetota bacterium]|nr:lysylphosphatidylglycerol synthase domain-containing protein [Actinomycetota bacterium]